MDRGGVLIYCQRPLCQDCLSCNGARFLHLGYLCYSLSLSPAVSSTERFAAGLAARFTSGWWLQTWIDYFPCHIHVWNWVYYSWQHILLVGLSSETHWISDVGCQPPTRLGCLPWLFAVPWGTAKNVWRNAQRASMGTRWKTGAIHATCPEWFSDVGPTRSLKNLDKVDMQIVTELYGTSFTTLWWKLGIVRFCFVVET